MKPGATMLLRHLVETTPRRRITPAGWLLRDLAALAVWTAVGVALWVVIVILAFKVLA